MLAVVLVLLVPGLLPASQAAPQREAPTRTVLFVCAHGAAKSVIAAAYFDRLARARGLPYRAVFRGSTPDPALSPATRTGLTREGFDVAGWTPEAVTRQDVEQAARVIVFAAPIPGGARAATVIDWNDVPAVSDGYDAASRAIRAHVERLIDQLDPKRK